MYSNPKQTDPLSCLILTVCVIIFLPVILCVCVILLITGIFCRIFGISHRPWFVGRSVFDRCRFQSADKSKKAAGKTDVPACDDVIEVEAVTVDEQSE